MRPAVEVADIFRRYGEAWRQTHDGHLGRVERRVMSAIELCRTAALGGHVEGCRTCRTVRVAYNSCRNRHCPKCQGVAARDWLEARAGDLLPVPYFHVVFTLPEEIAAIAFQNKKRVYGILFRAAAETLRIIAADPRHLGAGIGLIAVLHSWGQTLSYHPHLHCIVPGGGASPDGSRWVACRPNFFLPVRVLSRLFRRLFLEALHAAFEAAQLQFFGEIEGLADPQAFARILTSASRRDWVVYAKRRCCRTLTLKDSHRESMRLDGRHEQAITRPLSHHELVQLHSFAAQARITVDLFGQGDDLARAA